MVTQELIQYIKSQLQSGQTEDVIKSSLITNGWPTSDIESAFQSITTNSELNTFSSNISSSGTTAKGFPLKLVIVIIICLVLAGGGIFVFGSLMKNISSTSTEKSKYSNQHLPSPTIAILTKASSGYDDLIKNIMSEGWNKAIFSPSTGEHGVPFTFYYPASFVGQRGDQLSPANSIDTIDEKVATGQAVVFDQVMQLSSLGFESFDSYLKEAAPFATGQPTVTDFTTASGLSGKKITVEGKLFGNAVQFEVILLHTGKKSDLGNEIVIKLNGTYSYTGGKGKGTYTGSGDIIDKIAQTVSL